MPTERTGKGRSLLECPSTYILVDLETTGLDPSYNEIIEIAALRVVDDQIVDNFSSLVRPVYEIDEFITELTGITNEMVACAPTIDEVLPDFLMFCADNIIIGHNVHFDINFLYDNCLHHTGSLFGNDFVDTLRLSRRLVPELKNHKLATIAKAFNIQVEEQHRALADVETTNECYQVLKKLENERHTIEKSIERFNVKAKDFCTDKTEFNEDCPIFGKSFCFTGTLQEMLRRDAMQYVVDRGGVCEDRVTRKTDYLVLGNTDYSQAVKGRKTTKYKQAEALILKGFDVKIVSEWVFYDMLKG